MDKNMHVSPHGSNTMLAAVDCPFNTPVKFRTIVGWLIGMRVNVKFSYGEETSFFVSSKIKENKHWCTFKENEVYECALLNVEKLTMQEFENVGDEGLFPNYTDKDIWVNGFKAGFELSV